MAAASAAGTDEDLLAALHAAPTHGVNARELLLSAARDPSLSSSRDAARRAAAVSAAVRRWTSRAARLCGLRCLRRSDRWCCPPSHCSGHEVIALAMRGDFSNHQFCVIVLCRTQTPVAWHEQQS